MLNTPEKDEVVIVPSPRIDYCGDCKTEHGYNCPPTTPESVICAAVRTTEGHIIRGHRHHDAIRTIEAMGLKRELSSEAQGFVTSKGRYVDRKEAMKLQKAAGIGSVNAGGYLGDELYSEDLY